jgi:tetratricopeptide (TPR) repeat protein
MLLYRAAALIAAGRDEASGERLREILELNPALAPSLYALGTYHVARGESDEALALMEKAYTLTPLVPNVIGLLAGLLMRAGDTRRAKELLGELQPGDAFGAPRGLALYHWVLGELDTMADWIGKAIDQHDPGAMLMPRLRYGRELRSTPHWAVLMRKLNLPEA